MAKKSLPPPLPLNIRISQALKFIKEKKKLSRNEVALKIGVSPSYLSDAANWGVGVNFDILSGIPKNFPIRAYWLLTGEGDMEWKGKADDEIGFLLRRFSTDEYAKKTICNFLLWQDSLHQKEKGDAP
jgi:hypothetical protein